MSEQVDSQQPGSSNEALMKIDWNKCLLCQEVTSEVLEYPLPAPTSRHFDSAEHHTLSLNITRFSELNELPMPIDLRHLDEGNGVEATLRKEHGQMAQILLLKFNITKLKRAERENLLQKEVTRISPLGSTVAKVAFLWQTKLISAFLWGYVIIRTAPWSVNLSPGQ